MVMRLVAWNLVVGECGCQDVGVEERVLVQARIDLSARRKKKEKIT